MQQNIYTKKSCITHSMHFNKYNMDIHLVIHISINIVRLVWNEMTANSTIFLDFLIIPDFEILFSGKLKKSRGFLGGIWPSLDQPLSRWPHRDNKKFSPLLWKFAGG